MKNKIILILFSIFLILMSSFVMSLIPDKNEEILNKIPPQYLEGINIIFSDKTSLIHHGLLNSSFYPNKKNIQYIESLEITIYKNSKNKYFSLWHEICHTLELKDLVYNQKITSITTLSEDFANNCALQKMEEYK